MKPKQSRAETKPSLQVRLFAPLLVLLFVLPVASWVAASKMKSNHSLSPGGNQCRTGPWGDLEYVRIAIELPDHYIDVENIETNDWWFPGMSKREVLDFLQDCTLSETQMRQIEQSHWDISAEGAVVYPSDELIWSLTPECRGR
ncbi:MAG: hypothetical protein ACK4UN_07645, partial [Limisphaerales bacterium]